MAGRSLIARACAAACAAVVLQAALPAPAAPPVEEGLIRIDHAEEVVYAAAGRRLTLEGDVRVRRGHLSIRADRIVLYLDETGRKVDSGVATGDVRIEEGERAAFGERADLLSGGDKVILTGGPPRLVEGANEITAERITYTFSTRRLEARGAVRGVFLPPASPEAPAASPEAPAASPEAPTAAPGL